MRNLAIRYKRDFLEHKLRLAGWLLEKRLSGRPFCIVSNDCFGGEVYKITGRPFNTPFIGTALMAPCYLKLLSDLPYYLKQPLQFLEHSIQYEAVNDQRRQTKLFPVAMLGDIEIHFMHYETIESAREKWERRMARMDFSCLRLKFCMDKDYATEAHLKSFDAINYAPKLCFSEAPYPFSTTNIQVNGYDKNALSVFRNAMGQINLAGWLRGESSKLEQSTDKLFARALSILVN